MKQQNIFKSFLLGMSTIILPSFFQNQDIPRIELDKLTAGQKVQLDYARSLKAIKKGANSFIHE